MEGLAEEPPVPRLRRPHVRPIRLDPRAERDVAVGQRGGQERKLIGRFQHRYGPNRVGPGGLLQPLADIIKLMMKEELRPLAANKWLFYLAPVVSATAAFAAFATFMATAVGLSLAIEAIL